MSLKIKNGNFEVGIIDLFDFIMNNMDLGEYPEDVMDDLYDYLQWWHPVYLKLIDTLKTEYCSGNMNSNHFKLLRDFFLLPADWEWKGKENEVIQQMARILKELFEQNAKIKEENRMLSNIDNRLYDYIIEKYHDEDLAFDIRSHFHNYEYHNEDGEYSHHNARKMTEMIDFDPFAKKWVEEMYKLLEGFDLEYDEKVIKG